MKRLFLAVVLAGIGVLPVRAEDEQVSCSDRTEEQKAANAPCRSNLDPASVDPQTRQLACALAALMRKSLGTSDTADEAAPSDSCNLTS
jgi:hypothetical protein